MGPQLKVSSDRLGEASNRTCDPWFTRHLIYLEWTVILVTVSIIAVIIIYNQIITNVGYIDVCRLVMLVEVSAKDFSCVVCIHTHKSLE